MHNKLTELLRREIVREDLSKHSSGNLVRDICWVLFGRNISHLLGGRLGPFLMHGSQEIQIMRSRDTIASIISHGTQCGTLHQSSNDESNSKKEVVHNKIKKEVIVKKIEKQKYFNFINFQNSFMFSKKNNMKQVLKTCSFF